jgi:predicted 3-demethylubiquinone-9 3-methyltransferase (glyoxalase superfamily)
MPTLSKIAPSFWFVKEAEQAVNLYVSAFPDSRIDRIWTLEVDTPSGPPGSVKVVEFTSPVSRSRPWTPASTRPSTTPYPSR